MAYALNLASWGVIGGAGCFALACAAVEFRAMPSRIRALARARRALSKD